MTKYDDTYPPRQDTKCSGWLPWEYSPPCWEFESTSQLIILPSGPYDHPRAMVEAGIYGKSSKTIRATLMTTRSIRLELAIPGYRIILANSW